MINSRSLDDLLPRTASKCRSFIDACQVAGIDIIITSTYRDAESQDALYAQGRTNPGVKVTNVKGGDSFHNHRVAFDFVPIVNGKAVWDDELLWQMCGAIAQMCGLEWGGAWSGFVDRPHCQDTGGLQIADFKAGKAVLA
jgi:peptidoglycan L-alanyl-D-glutamate endopeptidase CwlK